MRLLLSLTIIGIALVSVPVTASSPSSTEPVDPKSIRLSRRKLYSPLSKRGHGHGKKKKKKHEEEEEAKKKEEKGGGSLLPGNSLPPSIIPSLPTLPTLPTLPPLTLPTIPTLFGGASS